VGPDTEKKNRQSEKEGRSSVGLKTARERSTTPPKEKKKGLPPAGATKPPGDTYQRKKKEWIPITILPENEGRNAISPRRKNHGTPRVGRIWKKGRKNQVSGNKKK